MVINDGTEEIKAKYHLPHTGVGGGTATPPTLTIYEPADAVADVVLTTFLYIEKMRSESEGVLVY